MEEFYFSEKDRNMLKFSTASIGEMKDFFGGSVPVLPDENIIKKGEGEINTELSLALRNQSQQYIHYLYNLIASRESQPGAHTAAEGQIMAIERDLLNNLVTIITNVIRAERRTGILNLFWLAFSKDFSMILNDYFNKRGVKNNIKYQMHPMLSGLLTSAMRLSYQKAAQTAERMIAFNLGVNFNDSLIMSIINDQFPLTETEIRKISLQDILSEYNKRYTLPFKAFNEIYLILQKRIKRGLDERERPLIQLVRERLRGIPENRLMEEAGILKMVFNRHIMDYLFLDYADVGKQLFSSPAVINAAKLFDNWSMLFNAFKDIVQGLQRTEIIKAMEKKIILYPLESTRTKEDKLFSEGRLYRFTESTTITNDARKVTIFFADLRGFTKTSERGFSEKEITNQLYTVFDPITEIVSRFGGKIDKFAGDGVMIIYGVPTAKEADSLNAVRTAILIQKRVKELRDEGKTHYQMGISIHTGRAYIANFMIDERIKDTTVIGRNVNIAGRLSATKASTPQEKDWGEFDDMLNSLAYSLTSPREIDSFKEYVYKKFPKKKMVGGVGVDEDGAVYNTGIAISRDVVDDMKSSLPFEDKGINSETSMSYYDNVIGHKVVIEYVGDAIFKGVDKSIPIYSVIYQ
ncbi:MAG: adenylate/guanylate cyclase domain-containing protein [Nitrospirota bacterium]|jgi:class 3 adenylate cyclase